MKLDIKLVRKKLEVLLKDEALVTNYLKVYGTDFDMKYVETIKKVQKRSKEEANPNNSEDDPLYRVKVQCPLCRLDEIDCYELRAKSQTLTYDHFMIPRYEGSNGFRTLNYSTFSVTVCPKCLFASPDKKDFITFSASPRTEQKSQLTAAILGCLKDDATDRMVLMRGHSDYETYFKPPRSIEAAIASYRLAISRALKEAELENAFAWYKAGMYGLKIAMLERDRDQVRDGAEEEILQESATYLNKSFQAGELSSHPETEYQLAYVTAAVYQRLGDHDRCMDYLGALNKLRGDLVFQAKTNPTIKTDAIDKWIKRTQQLWIRRDEPGLWKH